MSDNDEQLTHIETMRLFVSKQATIPKLAKNLLRLNRFLQALGELEVPFLKTIGLALTEVVSVIYKYQRKGVMKLLSKQQNAQDDLTEQDKEFIATLKDVKVNIKDLKNIEKEEFKELRKDFSKFMEKMDEALDILRKMHYLEGCKNIENQFKSLVNKEDKNLWATNFKNYVTEFENSLADFSKPKLVEYLQKIFDEKCNESLAELNKTYEYLLGCLSKYLLIITTYYAHLPDAVLKEVPDLDIVKEASNELLIYSNNIDDLNQAILAVCPFFFIVPNKNSLWKTQLEKMIYSSPSEVKPLPSLEATVSNLATNMKNLINIRVINQALPNLLKHTLEKCISWSKRTLQNANVSDEDLCSLKVEADALQKFALLLVDDKSNERDDSMGIENLNSVKVELLENLEEILENIYTTQCEESLAPLFNKYNEVVSSTVLNFTAQMHIILNGMDDQPKLKFDQITEATVRLCKDLEMLYDLGYKVIPDYFHPARILKPDWKLKPVYVPNFTAISDTKENYLGVFTSRQLYGPGWSGEYKHEVYGPRDAMTEDTINFTRVKDLFGDKQEYIVPIKSGLILDGGRGTRFTNGHMDYGTMLYPRNGNKDTQNRLCKYADGRCDYQERIYENGEWKYTLEFRFNESSLTWTKVDV